MFAEIITKGRIFLRLYTRLLCILQKKNGYSQRKFLEKIRIYKIRGAVKKVINKLQSNKYLHFCLFYSRNKGCVFVESVSLIKMIKLSRQNPLLFNRRTAILFFFCTDAISLKIGLSYPVLSKLKLRIALCITFY